MNLYTRHGDGWQSVYIDGNLQFDSRDEAVYHESLVLPALCLADEPTQVLIAGGGDGLALREALRFPWIEKVDLIDCSSEMIDLARTQFADLNRHAFDDPRTNVRIEDALEANFEPGVYDVAVCDFTYPTTPESSQVFSAEFYGKLRKALKPNGVLAVNAVSPQKTPEGFACIVSTLRAAGFHTLPYRVCVPSFREHGYGTWGFVLASAKPLTIKDLRQIRCPVQTRQADLRRLWRAASFSRKERARFYSTPPHRHGESTLQTLLLNPCPQTPPPDFPNLMEAIEVRHPYHSRSMVETLAEQIIGSIKSIDLRRLLNELSARAQALPEKLREELGKLRGYLAQTVLDLDVWGMWACRLLAALIMAMVIANSISPDPAFAKGAHGLGHSSFSRGYSHSTFGDPAGSVARTVSTGFRSSYEDGPVDVTGYRYRPIVFHYVDDYYDYGYGYGGGFYGSPGGYNRGGHVPYQGAPPPEHRPVFVLDDDLMVMDSGDTMVTLSDSAYLLLSDGKTFLMDGKSGRPMLEVYSEPKLFTSVQQEIASQAGGLDFEMRARRDWLSWVSWTSGVFSSVRQDQTELKNMGDLHAKLILAQSKVGSSPEKDSIAVPDGAVELFVGCHLLSNGEIVVHQPGGKTVTFDPKAIKDNETTKAASKELTACFGSIIKKLWNESQQDLASDQAEMADLGRQYQSTQNDLQQYNQLASYNGSDYQVDYGTDSMPAYAAIQLTVQDLKSINSDVASLQLDVAQTQREHDALATSYPLWNY